MNEKDLIAAFGGLERPDLLVRQPPAPGVIKCLTETCPVYLTIDSGRDYCRWCGRKRREELTAGGQTGELGTLRPRRGNSACRRPSGVTEHVSAGYSK